MDRHYASPLHEGEGGRRPGEGEMVEARSPVPAGSRVAFFTGLKKVTKESALWRCARHFCCRGFRVLTMARHETRAVLPATKGGGLCIRPPGGCMLSRGHCCRRLEFTGYGARIRIGPRLRCQGTPSRSIPPESPGHIKNGARDALRRRKAIFAYFFWRLQKSMASGGTRPAGLFFELLLLSRVKDSPLRVDIISCQDGPLS